MITARTTTRTRSHTRTGVGDAELARGHVQGKQYLLRSGLAGFERQVRGVRGIFVSSESSGEIRGDRIPDSVAMECSVSRWWSSASSLLSGHDDDGNDGGRLIVVVVVFDVGGQESACCVLRSSNQRERGTRDGCG